MQGQQLYYKMVAKAVISKADRIISAIDGDIAKADVRNIGVRGLR